MDNKEFIAKLEELGGKKLTDEELKEFEVMSEEEKQKAIQSFEDLSGLADVITNMSDEEKAAIKTSIEASQELAQKMQEEGCVEEGYGDDGEKLTLEESEARVEEMEKQLAESKTFWGKLKAIFRSIF